MGKGFIFALIGIGCGITSLTLISNGLRTIGLALAIAGIALSIASFAATREDKEDDEENNSSRKA